MGDVLLTSVGRRSYLVAYFKEALRGKGQVICTDMNPAAPAMLVADIAYEVPPSSHEDYLPRLLAICQRHNIMLHCSLSDVDTFHLSRHAAALRQLDVATTLPDAGWGALALDKLACTQLLQRNDIDVPWTGIGLARAYEALEAGELTYPVIIKARYGYGSLALHRCRDSHELRLAHGLASRQLLAEGSLAAGQGPIEEGVLIQQGISGTEYCVGIVNDLQGRYAAHMVCEVLAMRAGESDVAISVDPALAGSLPHRLSRLTGHAGIWGVDCLNDNGKWRVVDINPRFTGDYPFNHLAGARVPDALLAWARGEAPPREWLTTARDSWGFKALMPVAGSDAIDSCDEVDEAAG